MASLTLQGQVLFPDGSLRAGQVVVEGDKIAALRALDDAPSEIIAPGLIDLQVNGAFGADFTAQPGTIARVAAQLPRTGVTAFLPTLITAPLETYQRAFQVMDTLTPNGARVLGLHLEGPYLAPARRGAHNAELMRAPVMPAADGLLNAHVCLMTLAPELENALPAIHELRAHGIVVGLGHSAANFDQAAAALDAGAQWGTHLFNAMNPLHHRRPGLIGALLANPRATVGVIADGVHLHPSLLHWLVRAKQDRITLVTDAMAAAGLGAGVFALGDRRVLVDETQATLEDGTLAGSILTLDQAVRNVVAWGACSIAQALTMASAIPARLLGLDALGTLAVGNRADLIVLDAARRVQQTMIDGQVVFER